MKILIIEDEERLARSIKRGLEQEGHAVDYVLDGNTGEKRIELYRDAYELIILDLMLPDKSGKEVCRQVRADGVTTPILVLTARSTIEDKVTALDSGADDYLTKPFSFAELSARIRALVRRPTDTVVPELLVLQDVTIHTNSREAYRGKKKLNLTLKEFGILEYLMRRPNTVITREELYTHLWDFNENALSNVVDVHIKNLRKKVDEGRAHPCIETIRGVGYRFTA